MRTRLLLGATALLLLAIACEKGNTTVETPATTTDIIFTASCETAQPSKTTIDWTSDIGDGNPGYLVNWVADNTISVFDGTANNVFTAANTGETTSFSGSAATVTTYYALYPYNAGATSDGAIFTTTLPSVQPLNNGQLTEGLNIAVATSEANHFAFKNVLAVAAFRIPQQVTGCKYITIKGNDDETLAGDITINNTSGTPSVTSVANPSKVIKLTNAADDLDSGTYWFSVLPGNITAGFTITFYDSSDKVITYLSSSAAAEFKRSKLLNLGTIPIPITVNGTKLTYNSTKKCYSGSFDFTKGQNVNIIGLGSLSESYNRDFFDYVDGEHLTFIRESGTWTLEYYNEFDGRTANYFWVYNNTLTYPNCLYVLGNGKVQCLHACATISWYDSDYYTREAPYYLTMPATSSTTFQTTAYLTTDAQGAGDVRLEFYSDLAWNKETPIAITGETVLTGDAAGMFEICNPGESKANLHSISAFNEHDGVYRIILTSSPEGLVSIDINSFTP